MHVCLYTNVLFGNFGQKLFYNGLHFSRHKNLLKRTFEEARSLCLEVSAPELSSRPRLVAIRFFTYLYSGTDFKHMARACSPCPCLCAQQFLEPYAESAPTLPCHAQNITRLVVSWLVAWCAVFRFVVVLIYKSWFVLSWLAVSYFAVSWLVVSWCVVCWFASVFIDNVLSCGVLICGVLFCSVLMSGILTLGVLIVGVLI